MELKMMKPLSVIALAACLAWPLAAVAADCSEDPAVQALEKARPVRGGIPLLFERQRNNVQIVH